MILQAFSISLYRKYFPVVLLLLAGFIASGQETPLVVISHTKGAPSMLKMSELKAVLKGERQRWGDGTKVSIYLMKTATPVGKVTCNKVYNMSGDKVRRFWLELSFGGKAEAPTFCNSAEELEALIAQNPGAIGILDKSSGLAGTKTIMVDGKASF